MKKVNLITAIQLLDSITNQIFTVKFVKRSNNELRVMNCRKKVKKHLKGGKLNYSPIENNLLPVFDLQKNDYRMINLRSLVSLTINKTTYQVIN